MTVSATVNFKKCIRSGFYFVGLHNPGAGVDGWYLVKTQGLLMVFQ